MSGDGAAARSSLSSGFSQAGPSMFLTRRGQKLRQHRGQIFEPLAPYERIGRSQYPASGCSRRPCRRCCSQLMEEPGPKLVLPVISLC